MMSWNRLPKAPFWVLLLGLLAAPGNEAAALQADPFPVGSGVIEVDFDGTPLNLHYFKPAELCRGAIHPGPSRRFPDRSWVPG